MRNTGNATLPGTTVSDDQGVAGSCPGTLLPATESIWCTATGISEPAQYANLGTVTATDSFGTTVTDDDPSHCLGSEPGIAVLRA